MPRPSSDSSQNVPRPPQRIETELERLDDAALLELLLGRSARDHEFKRAKALLNFAGGLEGLARLGPSLLAQQAGLGVARATRLSAAFELGARRWQSRATSAKIDSLGAVANWAAPRLVPLDHEEIWVLSLDGRNCLRSGRRVGQGGLHGCALTARDILRPALRDGASAIVLVHNHPSGDPTPSPEDLQMTHAVVLACGAIGLPLLDHVIVAREGAASLLALGAIPAR